jgi:glycerol-3-phosphate acyltransferase PlsY
LIYYNLSWLSVPSSYNNKEFQLDFVYLAVAVLVAYLLGSISFAVVVSRLMGLSDPRTFGSKNPGATNVLRSGSKAAAILTLLLDAAKGWLPVFLVIQYGQPYGLYSGTLALVGVAAFLGHLYPIFFKLKGGKGVATALGVVLGISPWLGLAVALTWIIMAVFFRYSSLASVTAAVFAPFYYILAGGVAWYMEGIVAGALVFIAGFLLLRHAENLSRLIKGTESKLGSKKK